MTDPQCQSCKTRPAHYLQTNTRVCCRCFRTDAEMVCLCCAGIRRVDENVLMMSCPCFDASNDFDEEDTMDDTLSYSDDNTVADLSD